MKHFKKRSLALIVACVSFGAILSGCERAPSNVHVISTTDCGASWSVIGIGQAVPTHPGNRCGFNMALPNWPMSGEAEFKTQFAAKVLSKASISYTYQITDPLKFIKNASYLGKMGGSLEISSDSVDSKYTMAENIIINRTLREITTEVTRDSEIIDANPADLEDIVFKKAQETLASRGVTISDMAFVLDPDEQTRLAIDVATAMRVYNNAGIADAGKAIAIARAGASKIVVGDTEKSQKD